MRTTDQPVVVGVDGSEASLRAVDWAADEAALRGVPLHVVYAFPVGALRTRGLPRWPEAGVGAPAHRRPRGGRGQARQGAGPRPVGHHRGRARRAGVRTPPCGAQGRCAGPGFAWPRGRRRAAAGVGLPRRGRPGRRPGDRGARRPRQPAREPEGPPRRRGGPRPPGDSDAVRFAFREANRRDAPVEAVRVWHRPAHEAPDHPRFTGESAQAHRRRAFEILETGLRAPAEEQPDVEVRRRIVEGRARTVLPDASAEAALLVVGASSPKVASAPTSAVSHMPCCTTRPAPWRSSPSGPDSGWAGRPPGRPRTAHARAPPAAGCSESRRAGEPESRRAGEPESRRAGEPESREEAGMRREETAVVREETPCNTTRSAP